MNTLEFILMFAVALVLSAGPLVGIIWFVWPRLKAPPARLGWDVRSVLWPRAGHSPLVTCHSSLAQVALAAIGFFVLGVWSGFRRNGQKTRNVERRTSNVECSELSVRSSASPK